MTGDRHPSAKPNTRDRAHRVAVTEKPPAAIASPDYADAFEVARRPADRRSAERWARDGFERLPVAGRRSGLLAHRWILGFRLGPWVSPDYVFGWGIAASEPELLRLEARSTLFSGHMVWRLHDSRLMMTTFLRYEMHRTASVVWAALGNVHRGAAPHLLELAATAPEASDE
ncbi:MAG TPA: hypothetical protein VFP23_06460 [Solirubrobacterales bacterium]|nr:hypothetical protein [Solirubrobacterales bacterium]